MSTPDASRSSPLLPIVDRPPRPPHRHHSKWHTWLVRCYRVLLLGCAAWLIHQAAARPAVPETPVDIVSTELPPVVDIGDARRIFPEVDHLGSRDPERNRHAVLSATGETLGYVLRTSPETDDLIGYAGPSDLLIGLAPSGEVIKVLLLDSADTVSHVDNIRAAREFWQQFPGWQPGLTPIPQIEGVSGSTLTSLAMAEAVQRRLSGAAVSLRFPEVVTLAEVQQFFPKALAIKKDVPRSGWTEALDDRQQRLGYVVRTSPATDNQIGYQGPTECLFSVSPDEQTILAVRIRKSYETPDYVKRIERDTAFFELLAGRTIKEYRQLDFQAAGIEGVSGATITSFSIADGIRKRLQLDETLRTAEPARPSASITIRDLVFSGLIAGSLLMTFWPRLRGRVWRRLWQVILIAVFGIWLGDLLSLSLLTGWSRHGVPWETSPVLISMAFVSFGIPWLTKQQIYCHQLCPHGVVQEWLGKLPIRPWHLPRSLSRVLTRIPSGLLIIAFGLAVFRPDFDLTQLEPFDAWSLGALAVFSFLVAIIGLTASLVLPQAYCRFGCPTGALLKFVRSHGQQEAWGRQEAIATGVIALVAIIQHGSNLPAITRPEQSQPTLRETLPPAAVSGEAFGTTWSVRVRSGTTLTAETSLALSDEVARIERQLSHWKPDSETTLFNTSDTTLELEVSEELIQLVSKALMISELTQGRYDMTSAPLVDLWGYGPSRRKSQPTPEEIQQALPHVGWQKLHVDDEYHTLRKDDPLLQLDLGSILQGYTADRIADRLLQAGVQEFLIDVGGELRFQGEWTVAIDDPLNPNTQLEILKLRDQSLATSGTYRPSAAGQPTTRHIISPVTGLPTESDIILCAVISENAAEADAWATAYLLLPEQEAIALAEARQDSVLMVTRTGRVITSSSWPATSR